MLKIYRICVYSDQTNRIEADNCDLISLVTSIQVNIDPKKQNNFRLKLMWKAVIFIHWNGTKSYLGVEIVSLTLEKEKC